MTTELPNKVTINNMSAARKHGGNLRLFQAYDAEQPCIEVLGTKGKRA